MTKSRAIPRATRIIKLQRSYVVYRQEYRKALERYGLEDRDHLRRGAFHPCVVKARRLLSKYHVSLTKLGVTPDG